VSASDDEYIGWRLTLDPSARRTDGGRTLIGGSPLRVLLLSARGGRWLDAVAEGGSVPPGPTSVRLARRLVDGGLANPVPPAAGGPAHDAVALVVPVKDDAEGLARTLASAGAFGTVVVVDDGSADPDAVARAAGARAVVLRHPHSLGPAAARETGWRATSTPFVAFLDANVEARADWLDRVLPHFADATVAVVAPRVQSSPGRAPRWLAGYEDVRSSLDFGPAPAAIRPGSRVPYVPTAAVVIRRGPLESIGGFDRSLRVGEDVDVMWRLHAAGWRLRYEPTASVEHPARTSLAAWVRQRFDYGTSAAELTVRHGHRVAPLLGVSAWSAMAWGSVGAGHPVAGVAVAAGATARLVPALRGLGDPTGEALRIGGAGNLRAGLSIADAMRRTWWPLTAACAIAWRRTRPAILAALVVPPLLEWRGAREPLALDPFRYGALRLLDDVAYGTGVWAGCLRSRSLRALVPSFGDPGA
jgi:mycofactocin system glycosyltransferase